MENEVWTQRLRAADDAIAEKIGPLATPDDFEQEDSIPEYPVYEDNNDFPFPPRDEEEITPTPEIGDRQHLYWRKCAPHLNWPKS